jgi:hypothetical protein
MNKVLFVVAFCLGGLIAYVDSRPNWDDAGITALAIVVGCGLLGVAGPRRPWLWALTVGSWIPVLGILLAGNYGTLLTLPFAFGGAYAGMAVRRGLLPG